jgi:glycosyltransferase involved in cell wall biosynthesis
MISIVCVTYNEERLIAKTLDSFLSQRLDSKDFEIIVVDGMSEDRTREIVKMYSEKYSNVKLVDNPERKNPFGRNIGIEEAKGEYIALLGAHTIYNSDYIKVCIEEIKNNNAIGVSGKVVTAIDVNSEEAELCELILSSKFGVSGGSFRTVKEGYTSMVNFPVFKKEVFEKIGLYDTVLHRNQDNDFNTRILAKGFKLYNTWKTECRYYPPDTLIQIFSYAYKNGFWNAKSIMLRPGSMMLHHYIPFIFVLSILFFSFASVLGIFTNLILPSIILLIIVSLHLLTGFSFSLRIKKYRSFKKIIILPFLFFAFHFSYGWGTLKGFLTKTV